MIWILLLCVSTVCGALILSTLCAFAVNDKLDALEGEGSMSSPEPIPDVVRTNRSVREDRAMIRYGVDVRRDNAPVLPDVVLDHLATVYQANPWMHDRGILFDTFVQFPSELLAAGLDAPMPEHLAIRARIDRDNRHAELMMRGVDALMRGRRVHVSDGAIIETVPHKRTHRARNIGNHRPWRLGVTE
ncbi:MAG: hypothetical protein GC151_13755 [Betaproteobacteria bacterium]|nr:hypothetical protein [Betaproteobacteria bacterium]